MARNHRVPDLTTEVEMVIGRSSGNIEPEREYFVEITDSRSGFVIGKMRMGAQQYARLLTGGTVDEIQAKLAPAQTYGAIGQYAWHISLAFAMDFDGQGSEGNEERLESLLEGQAWGFLRIFSVTAHRRRGGIQATLRGASPTEEQGLLDAQVAAAKIQEWLDSWPTPFVQRGVAKAFPTEQDLARARDRGLDIR